MHEERTPGRQSGGVELMETQYIVDALSPSSEGGEMCMVHKPTVDTSLGLTFCDPDDDHSLILADGTMLCIIERVRPGSISETFLGRGDRLVAVAGTPCTAPMAAAKQLRSLVGDFQVEVLRASEIASRAAEAEEAASQQMVENSSENEPITSEQDEKIRPSSTLPTAADMGAMQPQPTGTHAHRATLPPPSPATPSTVIGSFHLNLPGANQQPSRDNPRDPKIFGNRTHIKLGAGGSANSLLREHSGGARQPASPRVRPLSARFRQLGAMLTPRGSHA